MSLWARDSLPPRADALAPSLATKAAPTTPASTTSSLSSPPPPAPAPAPAASPTAASTETPPAPTPLSPWVRNAKQLGLLLAGAGFMAASVAVARRSVLRRQRDALPKFYVSNRCTPRVDSADRSLLAVHALGLATLNVMSFAVMLTGGVSWAFDLCSLEELRERTQAALRRPRPLASRADAADERALEDMMSSLLGKLGVEEPQEPGEQARAPKTASG